MDISKLLAEPLPDRRYSEQHHQSISRTCPQNISHQSPAKHLRKASSTPGTEKPRRQICETCGQSFVSKAHLTIHDRTVHQRLKLHQCDICKSSFGQVGTLTRHKAVVHEKRRNHECSFPECKKRFGSRWTLLVHERNVHKKIKPYTCSFPNCDRQFGNAWNQRKHESQAHNLEQSTSLAHSASNASPVLRRY